MQLQQEKQTAKLNLLRKCGLLAHTSAAFLKNCCTEKLFRSPAARILLCTIKISLLYCHSVTPFILRMPSMPLDPHKFHFMSLQQRQQLLPQVYIQCRLFICFYPAPFLPAIHPAFCNAIHYIFTIRCQNNMTWLLDRKSVV